MTKEQQDLTWQCLPKETREDIRSSYKDICKDNEITTKLFLEELFGYCNLISDTESEEMLIVERKRVQIAYDTGTTSAERAMIYALFGDKCLPNKEPPFRVS